MGTRASYRFFEIYEGHAAELTHHLHTSGLSSIPSAAQRDANLWKPILDHK